MYVVGVGLKKVYKALIRLPWGTFSVPLLMSMSEASLSLYLLPSSDKSSGEGNGNLFQYSCLENSMDRGAL